MKDQIRTDLTGCQDVNSFGAKIHSLGEHYLMSALLDSDELVWEVAREIWKERGYPSDYEKKVYDEFEKHMGF